MKLTTAALTFAVTALLIGNSSPLRADTITTVVSAPTATDPGDTVMLTNPGPMTNDYAVTSPDPLWAAALPGSQWISVNPNTGNPNAPGFVLEPNGYTGWFFSAFSLSSAPILSATLDVYADDGTSVIVNGNVVETQTIPGNTYTVCSDVAVGCTPATEGVFNVASLLKAGSNTLQFDVQQHALAGFGTDYALTINQASAVPEPTTLTLFGAGIGLLVVGRRWRTRKQ